MTTVTAPPQTAEAPQQRRRRIGALTGLPLVFVAGGLGGLAHLAEVHHLGVWPLAAGLFVVQLLLAQAWPAALDSRGSGGTFLIGVAVAATADSLLAGDRTLGIPVLATIAGLSLILMLAHQIIRRPRPGIVGSLSAGASLVLLQCCAASLLALRTVLPRSGDVVAAGLFGLAAAALIARLADVALPRPRLAPASTRGIVGALLGIAGAAGAGLLWAHHRVTVGGESVGVRVALIAAVIGLIADLAVDVAAADSDLDARSRSALMPLGLLLPVVLTGPAIYLAARHLLG